MGLEAHCKATFAGQTSEGTARLEATDISFSGDFKFKIPFDQIHSAVAQKGRLEVTSVLGKAALHLGQQSEKWALKIRYPKSTIDKLGVKPGMKIALVCIQDQDFRRQVEEKGADCAEGRPSRNSDLIFFGATKASDLKRIAVLQRCLKPNGGIWVVWPKGNQQIKQSDVMAAAKQADLVDVKVVSFSDTHSSLRLVIPVSRR